MKQKSQNEYTFANKIEKQKCQSRLMKVKEKSRCKQIKANEEKQQKAGYIKGVELRGLGRVKHQEIRILHRLGLKTLTVYA